MNIPLLTDILIIFGLAIAVSYICNRLRIPTVVGFLLTGVVAGPYGLKLVKAVHQVEVMAEIGVILLLFSIGLEFSLGHLLEMRRTVYIGGTAQVVLTSLITTAVAWAFGLPLSQALFIGFLVALSSTAIVLKLLQEQGALESPHGRTALGILIFQDLIIVPMMIATPILAGNLDFDLQSLLIFLAQAAGLILLTLIGAKWLVPQLLYQIARTRNRELFLMSITFLGFSIAWLTSTMGLSLALGAFLAGLIISESEYSHNAVSNILPFRDIFMSLFFVSVGMLLDLGTVMNYPVIILVVTGGLLALKLLTGSAATFLLGFPARTAILVALALGQIGEFSFILAKVGLDNALISDFYYQVFLAVAVITMMVTPFVLSLGRFARALSEWLPLPERYKKDVPEVVKEEIKDHLIIIGFGVNGRNLARAAKAANIPYVVVELNPETVRQEQMKGEPIIFGDATYTAVLEHTHIDRARVLVVAISDPSATRQITHLARHLNPKLHIIARTRFLQEMAPLYELGADEVIPEEFETSIEIFTRVLKKYLIPRETIETLSAEVREDSYEMLRSPTTDAAHLRPLKLPDVEISNLNIHADSSLANKTLGELNLRQDYGVTLLAIIRSGEILSNPDARARIHPGDQVVVLGKAPQISRLAEVAAH